ncbi:hypothetical protein D9M68_762880 [compost metagenome]
MAPSSGCDTTYTVAMAQTGFVRESASAMYSARTEARKVRAENSQSLLSGIASIVIDFVRRRSPESSVIRWVDLQTNPGKRLLARKT